MSVAEKLSAGLSLNYLQVLAENIESNLRPTAEEGELVGRIFSAAEKVVGRMNALSPNPEQKRLGGVMVMARGGQEPCLVVEKVGEVNSQNPEAEKELDRDKLNKYFVYALAKAAVIIQNEGFVSSRENSKLLPAKQLNAEGSAIPGGAIKFGDRVVSFSGYSVEDDESMVLASLVEAGVITKGKSVLIAVGFGNQRYPKIVDELL